MCAAWSFPAASAAASAAAASASNLVFAALAEPALQPAALAATSNAAFSAAAVAGHWSNVAPFSLLGPYGLVAQGALGVGAGGGAPLAPVHVTAGNSDGVSVLAAGDVLELSDARAKTGLVRIDRAIERVLQLHGCTFERAGAARHRRSAGLLAQDVERALPEAVSRGGEEPLGVAYGRLCALFIEAIKEADDRIEAHIASSLPVQ